MHELLPVHSPWKDDTQSHVYDASVDDKVLVFLFPNSNIDNQLTPENAVEKINTVAQRNHMTWPEVYDGGGWNSRIAQLYAIRSIPQAFLVDGDTGKILASGGDLRGENLEKTIEKALAGKNAK